MGLHDAITTWVELSRSSRNDNSYRWRDTDGLQIILQLGGDFRVDRAEWCPQTGEVRTFTKPYEDKLDGTP